jgi:MFS family permease
VTRPSVPPASEALPRALRGFFLSAAFMDGGFFLIMVAMPFKVLDLGGGALELGLVPAIGAVVYIVSAPLAGHWSDRVSRTLLCLGGGAVLVAAALAAWRTGRLDVLLALQGLMGLGKSLYWPAVQATLGDLSSGGGRVGVLGRFNVSWSGGKTLGFLAGGLMLGGLGFEAVYLGGAACVVVAFLLLPKGPLVTAAMAAAMAGPDPAREAAAPASVDRGTLRAFRAMGWVANTAAYGAFGILTHHLPQWFSEQQWAPDRYGWYLGLILASQTVVFLLLAGPLRLAWSARRLWLPQLAAAAAVAIIPVAGFAGLLATAPVIGLGCGVCYAASIYYSLEGDQGRGRNAGIHEGLVGAGGLLPPLVAGLLVRWGLGLHAPYLLAAGLLLGALALQMIMHARIPSKTS